MTDPDRRAERVMTRDWGPIALRVMIIAAVGVALVAAINPFSFSVSGIQKTLAIAGGVSMGLITVLAWEANAKRWRNRRPR